MMKTNKIREKYNLNPIVSTMDKAIEKLDELNKIEVNYYLRSGSVAGFFNTIFIDAKPGMTSSDILNIVLRRHKKDKNIWYIKLLDLDKLNSEL